MKFFSKLLPPLLTYVTMILGVISATWFVECLHRQEYKLSVFAFLIAMTCAYMAHVLLDDVKGKKQYGN